MDQLFVLDFDDLRYAERFLLGSVRHPAVSRYLIIFNENHYLSGTFLYLNRSAPQGWAGQQPAASPSMASYGNLGGQKGSQLSYASPSQGPLNTPAAGTGAGSRPTCAPAAATQQICTCITINAGQQSADNTGSNQATAPVATPIASQSSAPSYSAPAASSSSGSQQSYASQSAPAQQSGGDHRGPAMAAYPAAAAPAQTSGGY